MIFSFIRGLLGGRSQPAASSQQRGSQQLGNPQPVPPPIDKTAPETALGSPPADSAEPIVLSFRLAVPTPLKRPESPGEAAPVSKPTCPKAATARRLPSSDPALSDPPLSDPALSDPALSDPALSGGDAPPRPKRRRRTLTLQAAGLGSAAQRRALRSLEIRTTVDLLAADASEITKRLGLPSSAAGTIRRWQQAIRVARLLPAMTPREALLLHAVHRKTLRRIAGESAPRLRRDLVRYAMSTAGSRLLGDRPLPSAERVKGWVEAARKRIEAQTEAAK